MSLSQELIYCKKYIDQEPPYLMRQICVLQWEEIKTKNSGATHQFLREKAAGADTGGGGGTFAPLNLEFFCSYFQNSFSIACLRERNPIAKQENLS